MTNTIPSYFIKFHENNFNSPIIYSQHCITIQYISNIQPNMNKLNADPFHIPDGGCSNFTNIEYKEKMEI